VVFVNILTSFGSKPGNVLIDGFTIRDGYNDLTTAAGAGLLTYSSNHLELRNCTVRNNQAFGAGGGLVCIFGYVDVSLCKFIANVAGNPDPGNPVSGDGGALLLNAPTDDCHVHNTEFKNNTATGKGGAFYATSFPGNDKRWLRFANVLFHGNSADYGGAGYVKDSNYTGFPQEHRAQVELVNCTLSKNSAQTDGEALFAEESNPFPIPNGRFYVYDSIVWGNNASSRVIAATGPSLATLGDSEIHFSIVEPPGSYWDNCSNGACMTFGNCLRFACDPLFVGTSFRLGAASPAIDAVLQQPGVLPPDFFDLDGDHDTAEDLPLDLDGRPRVSASGFVDMGCYEF